MEIYAAFRDLAGTAPYEMVVVEQEAAWSFIATHVVLRATLDDHAFRNAALACSRWSRSSSKPRAEGRTDALLPQVERQRTASTVSLRDSSCSTSSRTSSTGCRVRS